jgi:hypothetical protein
MRTPAGKECRYFYGNYFRGRNIEECRLFSTVQSLRWNKELCFTCPLPEILLANACENLDFIPRIERPFPFTKKQVQVTATCHKVGKTGFDPHIGCGNCHPLPDIFSQNKKP